MTNRYMNLVILLCTLNEESSLPGVLSGLAQYLPGARILVVDDDSEDRTAEIAAAAGAEVVVRKGVPRGRGLSGREGYLKALDMNPGAILEMDADGSHDPAEAPKLIAALETADIAVGSRWAAAGGGDDRGCLRRMISRLAKTFLRSTLGIPLSDPTSGFRAFRADALEKIDPAILTAEGPEIVEEI
ncbi:glycosyltransferase, partial [bacterium]|nr:glycosyltransferase [bacterium]